MSAVLKRAGAATAVRTLDLRTPEPTPATRQIDPLSAELAQLQADLALAKAAAADWEATLTDRVERARREGAQAALRDAADREAERTEALHRAIGATHDELCRRLASIDGLAAALARRALDRVFADPGDMAERVASMLMRQMAALRDHLVITIRVSSDDFADASALEAIGDVTRELSAQARIDPTIASGACRLDVSLGHIDLCLADQRSRLADALDAMAGGS